MGTSRRVVGAAAAVAIVAELSGCEQPRWHSRLASANAAGTDSGESQSWDPVLAPDGTNVVFSSYASNLGPTDTHPSYDIYVRDLVTGVTELVSANMSGTDSGNGPSRYVTELSPDGTKVLFASSATDLASPAPGAYEQLYMRDLTTDTTTLVSVNAGGTGGGNANIIGGAFSPDGTKVLFSTWADNIAGGSWGVFERDLASGVTTRLAAGCCAAYSPSGDAIAFLDQSGVGLRDRATGALTSVSVGRPGFAKGYLGFSHDGNKVAFAFETNIDDDTTSTTAEDTPSSTTSSSTTSLSTAAVPSVPGDPTGNPTGSPTDDTPPGGPVDGENPGTVPNPPGGTPATTAATTPPPMTVPGGDRVWVTYTASGYTLQGTFVDAGSG